MHCWPHWEEGEDERGLPVWLLYLDCGPWGLVPDPDGYRVRFEMPRVPWCKHQLFSDFTV